MNSFDNDPYDFSDADGLSTSVGSLSGTLGMTNLLSQRPKMAAAADDDPYNYSIPLTGGGLGGGMAGGGGGGGLGGDGPMGGVVFAFASVWCPEPSPAATDYPRRPESFKKRVQVPK